MTKELLKKVEEATMTDNMESVKVTKSEAIGLYNLIANIKSGKLSRESMIKYIPLRIKMKNLFIEYEAYREEISNQTKPEGFDKEKDEGKRKKLMEEWDNKVLPILNDWLKEPIDFSIKIFSVEDALDLIESNTYIKKNEDGTEEIVELPPHIQNFIYEYLTD